MKSSVALLLFVVVVFVATTSARPNYSESDLSTFDEERELEHSLAQNTQHRRKQRRRHSRQISDRYDYFSPSYYDNMREIDIIKHQINKLYEHYTDHPTWSTGPAYGGFIPVFIPVPVNPPPEPSCSCNKSNNVPNLGNRISDNDVNTIDEDDDDKGRPISFKPVNANRPQVRPPPPVEHGSVQAGLTPVTTEKPRKTPGVCEAAILMCCRYATDVQKQCFLQYGCTKTYSTGIACSPNTIALVIKRFKDAYAPT